MTLVSSLMLAPVSICLILSTSYWFAVDLYKYFCLSIFSLNIVVCFSLTAKIERIGYGQTYRLVYHFGAALLRKVARIT